MSETSGEDVATLPELDPDEPPDDEPIDDSEGNDPYAGRPEVVQETGTEEDFD